MADNNNHIPKHWKTASLIDDLPYIKTGMADYKGKKKYFSTGSIKSDSLIAEGEYTFNEKPSRANRIVSKGDVLQARMKNTDKAILIDSKLDGQLFSTGFFQIRADETNLNSKFIFYYLQSFKFKKLKDELCSGSTQEALNDNEARKIKIPIPPFEEQKKIVSKIEELLIELNNGINKLQIAHQQLKVYRQSLLKWAFEGKLTNKKFVEGELPKGWKSVELKNVVKKISDGPFGSNLKSIDYVDKGVRVIRLENIGEMEFRDEYKTFVTTEKYETIKQHTVGKGDIIFSSFISDSIRSVILPDFIEKAINKADCFLVRADDNKMRKKYLAYYFSTKAMRNQLVNHIHGATRPRINTTQLKASLIPFAPIDEQDKIVSELECKLTDCDEIEETISQSLRQVEILRQSILKKAFEGKLV